MADFDFFAIAPRLGGQREAFEELCCQIAASKSPAGAAFVRLNGAGGDGGIECFFDLAADRRVGWQAKFVKDIAALLPQLTQSLQTALQIHPQLSEYVVCFPFDLTGPTGRKGKTGVEKFNEWRDEQIKQAKSKGRNLSITEWPASKLRSELIGMDASGGIREFFFNAQVLSTEWFSKHLTEAVATAGPRYTPHLRVETDLSNWFNAFGQTSEWSNRFKTLIKELAEQVKDLAHHVTSASKDSAVPAWPDELLDRGKKAVADHEQMIGVCEVLLNAPKKALAVECASELTRIVDDLQFLESELAQRLEKEHGHGRGDSPGFRQFMAEYMVSFPAANLDAIRNVAKAAETLYSWLRSPAGWLAFERIFVLEGAAGSGKTHGVCDAATQRLASGRLSCVAFGHEFRGEPDPWTRLRECLGLMGNVGRDMLLDALNAAALASGELLVIWIDAINETRPLSYWRDRLAAFSEAILRRPHLRLCVTCRTSYVPHCIPKTPTFFTAIHEGFAGIERDACTAFFHHYELEPPVTPMLQPELANPLYLKLVCETLKSRGLRRLPAGWTGLATAIQAFLSEKESQFAAEHDKNAGAAIVSASLMAIAREIARVGGSSLPWSIAERVIQADRPAATHLNVLEWLVRADLLIEDAPGSAGGLDMESVIRPAFERLGDFLIARELLDTFQTATIREACRAGGSLGPFLGTIAAVEANSGIVSALSILLPEEKIPGVELPDVIDEPDVRALVQRAAVMSYPWRNPASFTYASGSHVRALLHTANGAHEAMDAALAVSWQASAIDAFWLDDLLKAMSMAKRDSFWCPYLHIRYERLGPVRRLIDAAFDLPLEQVEESVAERWAVILLWFTAAADRRVKDSASRAATALLHRHPAIVVNILTRMLESDDDSVRERLLLSIYGGVILSRDFTILGDVCLILAKDINQHQDIYHNALIRDHARSIAELTELTGNATDAKKLLKQLHKLKSDWPLSIPSTDDIEKWKALRSLERSCLRDDFFIYSMNCLSDWTDTIVKTDMGKWILGRVARDFGYAGSGCENYDEYMLGTQGGGRGKRTWAERIGKKYQWIALYQLAARLADHVNRKRSNWEPIPLRDPLILLDERQLDPTLPHQIRVDEREDVAWWVPATADLQIHAALPDTDWVQRIDDMPDLPRLLQPITRNGQTWRVLQAYPNWGSRSAEEDDIPYRNIWMHVRGYLIPEKECGSAFKLLQGRNFFGAWMNEGATWLYGFAGEYPWGAAYNIEPEEYHSRGGHESVPFTCIPVSSQIAVEWEYDATRPRNYHMHMPARILFKPHDLWWDGHDGYRRVDGSTVFRDPSFTEPGPGGLVADLNDLQHRLKQLKLGLIWTLLGERRIIGGDYNEQRPWRTFSQVALLRNDGSIECPAIQLFETHDAKRGVEISISTPKSSRKKKRN